MNGAEVGALCKMVKEKMADAASEVSVQDV